VRLARDEALNAGAFFLIVLVWGSTFLAIRVSNDAGYDPLSAVAVRLVLASLALVALVKAAGVAWPRGTALRATLASGFLIFGVNFVLLYWGEQTVASGTAAVLWGVYPALVAIGAPFVLRDQEPPPARSLAGALVASVGLAVVFRAHLGLDAPILGFAAILTGIASSTLATLLTKRWAKGVHPLAYNALGSFVGAMVLVPVALALGPGLALPQGKLAWASLAYLVLAGSIGAFNVWAWLLHRWPATRVSFQTVLSPLIAVALGWAFLAEPVDVGFLLGTSLVLAGTWLAVAPRHTAR